MSGRELIYIMIIYEISTIVQNDLSTTPMCTMMLLFIKNLLLRVALRIFDLLKKLLANELANLLARLI